MASTKMHAYGAKLAVQCSIFNYMFKSMFIGVFLNVTTDYKLLAELFNFFSEVEAQNHEASPNWEIHKKMDKCPTPCLH